MRDRILAYMAMTGYVEKMEWCGEGEVGHGYGCGTASGWCCPTGMRDDYGCRNDNGHYNVFGTMYLGLCVSGRSVPLAGDCFELPGEDDAGKSCYGHGARAGRGDVWGAGHGD